MCVLHEFNLWSIYNVYTYVIIILKYLIYTNWLNDEDILLFHYIRNSWSGIYIIKHNPSP